MEGRREQRAGTPNRRSRTPAENTGTTRWRTRACPFLLPFLPDRDLTLRTTLGSLVFSGCAEVDTKLGSAWADVRVPPAPTTATDTQPPQGTNPNQQVTVISQTLAAVRHAVTDTSETAMARPTNH